MQRPCDLNEGAVRLGGNEQGETGRRTGKETRGQEARAGLRCGQVRPVARIVEEGEVARPRAVERRDVADRAIGGRPGMQLRAGERSDVADGQTRGRLKESRLGHATRAATWRLKAN